MEKFACGFRLYVYVNLFEVNSDCRLSFVAKVSFFI